jgi:hypothetical protein
MPWRGSIFVKSVSCLEGFLYLNGQLFLETQEISCYYFDGYITYSLDLHLFSLFNVHDSQVFSFDGVTEFSHILFTALESSSVFSLIPIFSSNP